MHMVVFPPQFSPEGMTNTMKKTLFTTCLCLLGAAWAVTPVSAPELLWDMEHIAETAGDAKLTLHSPQDQEVCMVYDKPWEGNTCCYHTVMFDGTKYLMYYRGEAYKLDGYVNHEVACYAESKDGIHWEKPNLGICEWDGSKDNNIIWMNENPVHNFTACYDSNPLCPPDQKYKAIGGLQFGLYLFVSPDGTHWRKAQPEPIITQGAFDSQNTIFYDSVHACYVVYSRFCKDVDGHVFRGIQRHVSKDAINWSEPEALVYDANSLSIELYTNAIQPYINSPAVFIGLPKRFVANRTTKYDHSDGAPGLSDGGFMTSRDGLHFNLWNEAFVRPGLQSIRWLNRNNMAAFGMALTPSPLENTPSELSLYYTEGYYGDAPNRLRRMTIRQDGFVSMHASMQGGSFTMKPIQIADNSTNELALLLNASTSVTGDIRCEIRDETGKPLPNFTLDDSIPLYGDSLSLVMAWQNGANIKSLAGKTVILHFELKDADIFSFRFDQPEP